MTLANACEARMEDSSPVRYRLHCNKELALVGIFDLTREDRLPVGLIREALDLDWLTPGGTEYWTEWFGASERWRRDNHMNAYFKVRQFVKSHLTLELPRHNLLRVDEPLRLRLHSFTRSRRHPKPSRILRVGTIDAYPILYSTGANPNK